MRHDYREMWELWYLPMLSIMKNTEVASYTDLEEDVQYVNSESSYRMHTET